MEDFVRHAKMDSITETLIQGQLQTVLHVIQNVLFVRDLQQTVTNACLPSYMLLITKTTKSVLWMSTVDRAVLLAVILGPSTSKKLMECQLILN